MKTITQKIQNIEKIVTSLDKRVRFIENNFATKDDLKGFATKNDLKNFATKDDLKNFSTKDDLKKCATKDDLKNFATKDDIRLIIDHIDAFFVRDNRIKIVETTMHKHEERLTLLEQR